MKRVLILNPVGRLKPGYGVEVEDAIAAMWAQQGICSIGAADQALKKGNLELYNNCTPITPAEAKKVVKPPVIVPASAPPETVPAEE